jgi:molybdate-binding protein
MRWREVAGRVADEIAAGRWEEGERLPGVRTLARTAGCSPATAARAYAALRDAGLLSGTPRSAFAVSPDGAARAVAWDRASGGSLRIAGSDDPALDILVRAGGGCASVADGPRGSVRGLVQLARGTADAAAVHLLDVASGRWNEAFARGALAGQPVLLIHLWRREQGLVVQRSNPMGIRGVGDLARHRVAWRPAGSGSRMLLERLMLLEGADPRPEQGSVAESHLAVAAAVAAGVADAGLAVRAVAESLDLDWIPVATEWFELTLAPESRAAAKPLLRALGSAPVQERLATLPGYDLSMSGEIRTAA